MTEVTELSRQVLINELLKIGHGDLGIYTEIGLRAAKYESELFAHLIAWNQIKGQVRDSKVAFPVLALRGPDDHELYENAAAHLCLLDPRNLLKAAYYHRSIVPGASKLFKAGVLRYIRAREDKRKWWDRTVLQHRRSMKGLYALHHIKPADFAQDILFERKKPVNSVFAVLPQLKNMAPLEAAGTILNYNIPFLIAVGAMGGLKNNTDLILALIEQMSGAELLANTNMLKKLGVQNSPSLKSAYSAAIERAKKDKRVGTLKAKKAAEVVGDEKIAAKLKKVQDEKLSQLGGIDGDWLVLGDRSGSMERAIDIAKQVSSLIAQQVKGNVHLVFFNNEPIYFNVTGMSLDEIEEKTRRITAQSQTSIGCGLEYIRWNDHVVNGIAICTDSAENYPPRFVDAYRKYVETVGIEPTINIFQVSCPYHQLQRDLKSAGLEYQQFDVDDVDYYSLPNLISMLKTNKYKLVDEIMETDLLTLNKVFGGDEL
jgi:hypothetical protein